MLKITLKVLLTAAFVIAFLGSAVVAGLYVFEGAEEADRRRECFEHRIEVADCKQKCLDHERVKIDLCVDIGNTRWGCKE